VGRVVEEGLTDLTGGQDLCGGIYILLKIVYCFHRVQLNRRHTLWMPESNHDGVYIIYSVYTHILKYFSTRTQHCY
jgi:hypothetical protein